MAFIVSKTFPLKVHDNGRYLVDQNGVPFRIHGDTNWDWTINLSLADARSLLADRASRGFNAIAMWHGALRDVVGGQGPFQEMLGGRAAGNSALPFLLNTSSTSWDGDPNFANHDALFSSPNDAFWANQALCVDAAAACGMVVFYFFMYNGSFHAQIGDHDGWAITVQNSGNTSTVCTNFGTYLANGHGTFTGFKNRPNIIWVMGADSTPANGSTLATRELAILQGMQAAGDTHLVTHHLAHDTLATNQTDWSSSITVWAAYSNQFPYGAARATYKQNPTKPTFLIESPYWGEFGQARHEFRYEYWGAVISTVGGAMFGMGPVWEFWTSPDGSTNGVPSAGVFTMSWQQSQSVGPNQYRSNAGNWYKSINASAGTTASSGTGPSGTGTSIADNTVTWTFVCAQSATMQGMANLLAEPGVLDFQTLGKFMDSISWHRLIPESLAGTGSIITSGQGTFGTWTDGGPGVNAGGSMNGAGGDWIVASCSDDGATLLAYVPHGNSGTCSVDMTRLARTSTGWWVDPVSGAKTLISSSLANTGTHSFTRPGNNSGGDADWALLLTGN